MTIYCTCCGNKADWLSMRSLCVRCQRVKGALSRRVYDWRTGKLKVTTKQVATQ